MFTLKAKSMKTNNVLTYLLYALLLGLIATAGYKACQMQQDKKQDDSKEEAELQQALRDMGYTPDSSNAAGSAYTGESTNSANTNNRPSASGIEDEPIASNTQTSAKPVKENTVTTPKSTGTTPKTVARSTPSPARNTDLNKDASGGRYQVRAGSFVHMQGAREQLEMVIKAGFPNAEIGKANGGKFAVVVVLRTNDKAKALQIMDKLEMKGIDALVYDVKK